MSKTVGCACDAFADALLRHFIEVRQDRFFLADQEFGKMGQGWSSQYGPEILYCPFCSDALLAPKAPPRADTH